MPPQSTTTSQSMSPAVGVHPRHPAVARRRCRSPACAGAPATPVGRAPGWPARSRAGTGRRSRPRRGRPRRPRPSVSISGNSSCASAGEISCSGSPYAVAQLICRRISSIRSGDDASRMPPHSTQPGGCSVCLQPAVELDGVHVHPGQRRVGAQLADQAGGVERRAAGQLGAVDEHDVGLAELGQVVGDARAADAAADDDDRRRTRAASACRRLRARSRRLAAFGLDR